MSPDDPVTRNEFSQAQATAKESRDALKGTDDSQWIAITEMRAELADLDKYIYGLNIKMGVVGLIASLVLAALISQGAIWLTGIIKSVAAVKAGG